MYKHLVSSNLYRLSFENSHKSLYVFSYHLEYFYNKPVERTT